MSQAMQCPQMTLEMDESFLGLAISFVDQSLKAFSFPEKESMGMVLAVEEIFSYLARNNSKKIVELACKYDVHAVEFTFCFNVDSMNLRSFNLASTVKIDDEESLSEMGLFLASRSVDEFNVKKYGRDGIILSLKKNRIYPKLDKLIETLPPEIKQWKICAPTQEDAKVLISQMVTFENALSYPEDFSYPGKIADLYKTEKLFALSSESLQGNTVGGIFWRFISKNTAEFLGPYVWGQTKETSTQIAEELISKLIEEIAKTGAVVLFNKYRGQYFPKNLFEFTGNNIYLRQIKEDLGASSWVDPSLKQFVEGEYHRLFMPRVVKEASSHGEMFSDHAVLASHIERSTNSVTLRPILYGKNFSDVLKSHLELFRQETIERVYFEMDLGNSSHPYFSKELIGHNFKPLSIIPYGGQGDLLTLACEL